MDRSEWIDSHLIWISEKSLVRGYPMIRRGPRAIWGVAVNDYVHRLSLERKLGRSLEPGEQSLHTCDIPRCWNPDHLYAGDNADNQRDAWRRDRAAINVYDPETGRILRRLPRPGNKPRRR
jgi:hypothetical protein